MRFVLANVEPLAVIVGRTPGPVFVDGHEPGVIALTELRQRFRTGLLENVQVVVSFVVLDFSGQRPPDLLPDPTAYISADSFIPPSTHIESPQLRHASVMQLLGFRGMVKLKKLSVILFIGLLALVAATGSGCGKTEAKDPAPQPLPVNTQTVNLTPVPRVDEYVATVKSRRSATIQPQVDGSLTRILVKSGDHVGAGEALMTIDPLKQQATVEQQRSTEAQKKATYDYNKQEQDRPA